MCGIDEGEIGGDLNGRSIDDLMFICGVVEGGGCG